MGILTHCSIGSPSLVAGLNRQRLTVAKAALSSESKPLLLCRFTAPLVPSAMTLARKTTVPCARSRKALMG